MDHQDGEHSGRAVPASDLENTGMGVELIDYKDIDRKPVHPRFQDPGAANLILTVRNIDAILAKAKKAGGRVISKGGEPATMPGNGKNRVAFVQDPDGFFVELSQRDPEPQTTAPAASNVIGGAFEIIVNNTDDTMRIYRDILGFQPQIGASFDGTKLLMETAGTPGAQFRRSAATIPGTSVLMAFLEFKDIDRKPFKTRVQDPGTAILQLQVRDADAVTQALKAAGATVISAGGEPVNAPNGGRFVIVRDPNNLFLELFQRAK
jgi:predicted enzyme related to lactoylglutathione lyase